MSTVAVEKLIHINQLLGDFAGANRFYREVFAAQEYMNNFHEAEERDASLFVIGDTCIELFSPRTETSLLGRQLARSGDGWHSFEWKVPDLEAAKAALDERGIRCGSYYPGAFLMTHPKDTHGMILEMCPTEMADDPRLEAAWDPTRWRDGHPMGIRGLNCISVAVRDLDAAVGFICDLTGGQIVYEADRPLAAGRAVGVRVADHDIELLAPSRPVGAGTEDGAVGTVADYLERVGPRIRSIVFQVEDLPAAEKHLAGSGLRTLAGDFAGATALHPADNYGVLWQFTEEPRPHPAS